MNASFYSIFFSLHLHIGLDRDDLVSENGEEKSVMFTFTVSLLLKMLHNFNLLVGSKLHHIHLLSSRI